MKKVVMKQLVDSWFNRLDGYITYGGKQVKGYKEDAPNTETFHHYIIRAESETDDSNKRSFVTNAVVILEVVTVHEVSVQRSVVDDINEQITGRVFPTRKCALPALHQLQITNVSAQGGTYLKDDDGTKKYYRKVTRFIHRITQTT